jgi:hypothetical protein
MALELLASSATNTLAMDGLVIAGQAKDRLDALLFDEVPAASHPPPPRKEGPELHKGHNASAPAADDDVPFHYNGKSRMTSNNSMVRPSLEPEFPSITNAVSASASVAASVSTASLPAQMPDASLSSHSSAQSIDEPSESVPKSLREDGNLKSIFELFVAIDVV